MTKDDIIEKFKLKPTFVGSSVYEFVSDNASFDIGGYIEIDFDEMMISLWSGTGGSDYGFKKIANIDNMNQIIEAVTL